MLEPKKKITLTSQALEGISWTYFSLVFRAVLQLITLAILARMLTPREFGVVSLALIFTNFIERVGFLGLGPALVQKATLTELEIQSTFLFSITLGLFIALGFYFSAEHVAVFMNDLALTEVLQAFSLLCLIESACQILEHLLQRDLRFKSMLNLANLAYGLGNGFVSITLAFLGYGVWALVYGTLVTRGFRLFIFYYLRPIRIDRGFSIIAIKELLYSGFGFAWSRLFSFLAISSDNFVVGKLLGAAALGMYGRGYQLMTLPSTYLGQVLEKVLFPAMAKKQHDRDSLEKVYLWTIQISSLIGIPTSIFMYIAAPEIILFLFGGQWVEVIPTLKILSIGVFFRLAYKNSDTLVRSVGAVYKHAIRQFAYTFTVIVGSVYGVRYGISGVACAVSLAVFLNYFLLSELGLRILNSSWKKFLQAHLLALWIGGWSILTLPFIFLALRAYLGSPFSILLIGLFCEGLIILISVKLSPKGMDADVLDWLFERFKIKERGKIGKLASWAIR